MQAARSGAVVKGVSPPRSTFCGTRERVTRDSRPSPGLIQAFDSGDAQAVQALMPGEGADVNLGIWMKRVGWYR